MKTKTLLAALAGLFTTLTYGQTNNFYRPVGAGLDHGIGREVIESFTPNEFVVVGTSYTASLPSRPVVTVSKYGLFGAPMWSNIYPINVSPASPITVADGMSIALNPYTGEYGVLAYVESTAAGSSQSVLIRIDAAGNYLGQTELGPLRATSVIFDPTSSFYAVLGQVDNTPSGGTVDLQLTFINAAGFILSSHDFDSGTNGNDRPSRLCMNPVSNNYTLVGTTFNGTDDDLFIVHTDHTASFLISSTTYDVSGGNEIGVDVTVGVTNSTAVVVAYASPNYKPFIVEIDDFSGAMMTRQYILTPTSSNIPTAIATDVMTGNIIVCGIENSVPTNTNGFSVVLDFLGLNPLVYQEYGQSMFLGNEDLTDVVYSQTTPTVGQFVMTGEHQLITPQLPNFPSANEYYNWLVMTDPLGGGACSMPNSAGIVPIVFNQTPSLAIAPSTISSSPLTIGQRSIGQFFLNECTNPNRLAPQQQDATTNISVFPNPASTQLTLSNPSESSVVFEMTNALGDVVMRETIAAQQENFQLDVSNIAPGIYFYQVMNRADVLSKEKIVIAR